MVDSIYSNYTNFVYKVEKCKEKEVYVLFNPSIHFWVSLDSIGKEIFELAITLNSVEKIQEKLVEKYNIDHSDFIADVIPFLQELLNKKFLSIEPTPLKDDFSYNADGFFDIENYPFNEMYVSLSDDCNLNCLYCFNKEMRKQTKAQSNYNPATYEEIINVVEQFKKLNGSRIVLTGGEPTLNKHFEKICQYCFEIGLEVGIITNGLTLLNKKLDDILPYVTSIGLSLDSVFQEELIALWGIKDIKISEKMREILRKLDRWSELNHTISINIMPISCNINYKSMPQIISSIASELTHCNVSWQIVKYDKINNQEIDDMLDISEAMYISSIIEGLSSISDISSPNVYNKLLKYAYSNSGRLLPAQEPKQFTCAPSFFITATGDIKPCQGLDSICLGNIRNTTLKEAFMSKEFQKLKSIICKDEIPVCKDCELRYVCESEKRECYHNKDNSTVKCKEKRIYQMYLETLCKE